MTNLEDHDDNAIRVLMVGEHGVGKTSLCHWLEAGGAPKRPPRPTVGCNVVVLESYANSGPFLVEIREVGGHGSFAEAARSIFYSSGGYDAVIIVYDVGVAAATAAQATTAAVSGFAATGGSTLAGSYATQPIHGGGQELGQFPQRVTTAFRGSHSLRPERYWLDRLEGTCSIESDSGGSDWRG